MPSIHVFHRKTVTSFINVWAHRRQDFFFGSQGLDAPSDLPSGSFFPNFQYRVGAGEGDGRLRRECATLEPVVSGELWMNTPDRTDRFAAQCAYRNRMNRFVPSRTGRMRLFFCSDGAAANAVECEFVKMDERPPRS